MELVSDLYPPLLDRSRPLWEAYVVDGLERGRMAVFVKAHHALADGVGGLRMFHASMSEAPGSDPRPLWAAAPEPGPRRRTNDEHRGRSVVSKATELARVTPKVAAVLPAVLRLARTGPLPFAAARTPSMAARTSPARSFATLDLPLAEVKEIGKQFGGTVNDVVLSVCDDAMQRYVRESDGACGGRMVSVVPVSTRRVGDESGSNAVAATLVALGAPDATPSARLRQVVSMELREQLPIGRGLVPDVANFTVSNISGGPQKPLYLGEARLAGFYVTPIVGPSQAANFTVLSCQDSLCLGIGAARSIIPDTTQLARLARTSFDELTASERPAANA
jgi:WS/DGAT/MGAT family acyltransferase